MAAPYAAPLDALLDATSDTAARKASATAMAAAALKAGVPSLAAIVPRLKAASEEKKNAGAREGCALGFEALAAAFGKAGASHLFPHIGVVTGLAGDATAIKAAAEAAAPAVFGTLDQNAVEYGAPFLFEATAQKYKWQSRVLALQLVGQFSRLGPGQTVRALPSLIPSLTAFMGDARKEVSAAAEAALLACCEVNDNRDIAPFIPTLVSCVARPDEVKECVYKLSSTTFVQAVGPPTLAIIMPVLERGLKERELATKRKVSGPRQPSARAAAPRAAPAAPAARTH
jgi:elongation factor 3